MPSSASSVRRRPSAISQACAPLSSTVATWTLRDRGEAAGGEAGDGALGGAAAVVGDHDRRCRAARRRLSGTSSTGRVARCRIASRVAVSSLSVSNRKLASRPMMVRSRVSISARMLAAGRPTTSSARAATFASRQRRSNSASAVGGVLARVGDQRLVALVLVAGAADSGRRRRRGCRARRRSPARPAWRRSSCAMVDREAGRGFAAGRAFETDESFFDHVAMPGLERLDLEARPSIRCRSVMRPSSDAPSVHGLRRRPRRPGPLRRRL